MQEFFQSLLDWLAHASMELLPTDPLAPYIREWGISTAPAWVQTAKGWLNWLMPFSDFAVILSYIMIALAAYYLVRVLLGWLRAVQ